MASSKNYLEFVLDQLSGVPGITSRAMMGEYILYCRGKIFGGVYDDRLLVKNIPAARRFLPEARLELPYEGGSPMILADIVDDRDALAELVEAMTPELPEPKKRG